MKEAHFLICLEKGCRFSAETVPDRICPTCGGEMAIEGNLFDRMRPKTIEEVTSLPEEVRKALENPENDLGDLILIRKVGSGGGGEVFRAWQKKLRRFVAVKFLTATNPGSIQGFQREAQLAAQLRHPHIASIHQVREREGKHFLVMDFIDGHPIGMANLSIQDLARVFIKVCRAVEFAHGHSIIHRDLKPSNILYGRDGEPSVTDFGLAKVIDIEGEILESRGVVGTPAYMSPEQARGKKSEIDQRSDIFSLGSTLYTLTTGRLPFDGENVAIILGKVGGHDPLPPRKANREIPAPVDAIILKAMEKEKSRRYGSAGEMADDLERFLRGERVLARPRGPLQKWARRNLGIISAVGIALFVLLGWTLRPRDDPGIPVPAPVPGAEWKARSSLLQARLTFLEFDRSSPDMIRDAREILSGMPPGGAAEIIGWLATELEEIPGAVWPKPTWFGKRPEALRILDWCDMMSTLMEGLGASFTPVLEELSRVRNRFAPVTVYRGQVTLRLLIWPFAELRSLRAGEKWVIRDGRKVDPEVVVPGNTLHSPLEIRNLEIADYRLVLSHPDLGDREFRLKGDGLREGGTYACTGSLTEPGSILLRPVP